MFTVTQPGRIVRARLCTIGTKTAVLLGTEGMYSRVSVGGEGIVIAEAQTNDPAAGYQAQKGEILTFSGTASFYNTGESDAAVSVLTLDVI